jgi:hypothetical protein
MKQKRIKPRPIRPKGSRSSASGDYDHRDWFRDCQEREYKKSDKYKQGQKLAEKFKSKLP